MCGTGIREFWFSGKGIFFCWVSGWVCDDVGWRVGLTIGGVRSRVVEACEYVCRML